MVIVRIIDHNFIKKYLYNKYEINGEYVIEIAGGRGIYLFKLNHRK